MNFPESSREVYFCSNAEQAFLELRSFAAREIIKEVERRARLRDPFTGSYFLGGRISGCCLIRVGEVTVIFDVIGRRLVVLFVEEDQGFEQMHERYRIKNSPFRW